MTAPENEPLLTTGEVASLYRVDAKSVARWVKTGKLAAVRTPGGRLRFREAEIRALLNPETQS